MRTLTSFEVVRLWDEGLRCPQWRLGALLLAPILPRRSQRELLSMTLGEMNELLIAMHRSLAGDRLNLMVDCPACAQRLEFVFDAGALGSDEPAPRGAETVIAGENWRVRIRALCARDLGLAANAGSLETAAQRLWRQAVLAAEIDGTPTAAEELADDARARVADAMSDIDPNSEIRLALSCPECGRRWVSLLDVASVVFAEVALQGRRVMEEVHSIASAYGWSESEILSMNPQRRRYYLELLS